MAESRKQKRKKLKEPKPMAEALGESLNTLGHRDYSAWVKLYNAWEQIVGSNIANRTHPRKLHRGLLILQTTSAVWKNELTFLKQRLIQQINTYLDQETIKDIKVTHGKEKLPEMYPPPPKPVKNRPANAHEIAQSQVVAASIEDPDLRDDFAAMMQKYLTRKTPPQ